MSTPENNEIAQNETPNFDAMGLGDENQFPSESEYSYALIARKSGLSASTVSRAFKDADSVTNETKTKITQALKQLEAESTATVEEPEPPPHEEDLTKKVKETEPASGSSKVEVENSTSEQEPPPPEPDKEDKIAVPNNTVSLNNGRTPFLSSQYNQVGVVVDYWSDLIQGFGGKKITFSSTFVKKFKARSLKYAKLYNQNLTSTGLVQAPYRRMIFIERYPVTVTLYVAEQGDDLYVSWRAFAKAQFSSIKLALIAGASLLFGFIITWLTGGFASNPFNPRLPQEMGLTVIIWSGIILISLVGWFIYRGIQSENADYLHYFREPLNELYVDDVLSLANLTHQLIIEAADKVGIDTTKLEPREPFFKQGRKRRF